MSIHTTEPTPCEERIYSFSQGANADLKDGIVKFSKKDDGILIITDLPVFRSGTFRNSWGEQSTWADEDIETMVNNYHTLKDARLFEDVPIRDGHPGIFSSGGTVVGWHTDLHAKVLRSHTDDKFNYLLADVEITEPDAAGKVERRTWRNRSSEIGKYRTNQDIEYSPVYMGFAYVDIPAVEGLNAAHNKNFSRESGNKLFFMAGKDFSVPDDDKSKVETPPAPVPAVVPVATPPAPVAPAVVPVQRTDADFKINGSSTVDYTAVQRHIDTLEGFQKETKEQARKDFVASLAADNKILANEETIKASEAFALGLSDEQFTAWKATWNATPVSPVLQQHGKQSTDVPGTSDRDAEIATLTEQVRMHQDAGMPLEKLQKLPSYTKLEKLKAQA